MKKYDALVWIVVLLLIGFCVKSCNDLFSDKEKNESDAGVECIKAGKEWLYDSWSSRYECKLPSPPK